MFLSNVMLTLSIVLAASGIGNVAGSSIVEFDNSSASASSSENSYAYAYEEYNDPLAMQNDIDLILQLETDEINALFNTVKEDFAQFIQGAILEMGVDLNELEHLSVVVSSIAEALETLFNDATGVFLEKLGEAQAALDDADQDRYLLVVAEVDALFDSTKADFVTNLDGARHLLATEGLVVNATLYSEKRTELEALFDETKEDFELFFQIGTDQLLWTEEPQVAPGAELTIPDSMAMDELWNESYELYHELALTMTPEQLEAALLAFEAEQLQLLASGSAEGNGRYLRG